MTGNLQVVDEKTDYWTIYVSAPWYRSEMVIYFKQTYGMNILLQMNQE